MRTAYFAQAGEFAVRYAVEFERIVEHVRFAERTQPEVRRRPIRYVDDLIQTIACVDGYDVAWSDLVEQHERALIRTCRDRLEPTDAIVFVRRFFAWMRQTRRDAPRRGAVTLAGFDGSVSLRRWLRERILDALDLGDPWADDETADGTGAPLLRWVPAPDTAPTVGAG